MRRLIALAVVGSVVLALVLAQIVLPGVAAHRLRDQLARTGQVLSVQVQAFPAIELLWKHADRVVIHLGRYRVPGGKLGTSLRRAADVGSLLATATEVDTGRLTLHGAWLVKEGHRLSGRATVTEADLRAAVPILDALTPVASASGQLTLRGTASLLGVTASVDATVRGSGGKLVVSPDVPFGGLASITVFSDPHVSVESVGASAVTGGFVVRGSATIH